MASPGDLDTSFSGDGKKTINFGGTDVARVVLMKPNGKIADGDADKDVSQDQHADLAEQDAEERHASSPPFRPPGQHSRH